MSDKPPRHMIDLVDDRFARVLAIADKLHNNIKEGLGQLKATNDHAPDTAGNTWEAGGHIVDTNDMKAVLFPSHIHKATCELIGNAAKIVARTWRQSEQMTERDRKALLLLHTQSIVLLAGPLNVDVESEGFDQRLLDEIIGWSRQETRA